MAISCHNSEPYNPAQSQTHCALLTPAFGDPHHAGAEATKAGSHKIMKHLRLAGGRQCNRKTKSMRDWRQQMGGDLICPATVPPGSSSWPTFANQNGPFSTAQNANTASQTNNALSASTKAQAMYDHEASNMPSDLQGTPQVGGRRRKSITKHKNRTKRKRKGKKRSIKRGSMGRTKGRTRMHRKGRTRIYRGGHKDRRKTWGCSSGGGGHRGRLWNLFSGRRDMLRHKTPYP